MVRLNPVDTLSNEYCKYNDLEHQTKYQEQCEYVLHTHESLIQKLKSFISQLSTDDMYDLIEQICEFKIKANEIQQQLEELINEDKKQINKAMTNGAQSDQKSSLANDIGCLRKDIEQLKLKLDQINNFSHKRVSINLLETTESPLFDIVSPNKKDHLRPDVSNPGNSVTEPTDSKQVLSHLLLKQMSPSIIDLDEYELDLTEADNETHLEEEEEEVGVVNASDTAPKINKKVRLSNNIVGLLRGPFKTIVEGTLHTAEIFANEPHASDATVQAVEKGLARQKQIAMEQQTTKKSLEPTFVEITPDWIYEGENSDHGFSSASIWIRDPQGQRILVKTEDLPLCAANEWLAYALGRQLGLPVNKVQIAIYEEKLVTLHTDVSDKNEKTVTLMQLPRRKRKKLLTTPLMGRMDLFDRIIQNVDRNARNILITIPDTSDIDDDTTKLKIYLIDHGSCFGMGKLNAISLVASKYRTHHLSVVKFDPIDQARKFDQYLGKLSVNDRILMKKTLNRFAAITDEQIANWMTEVEDLLTSSQYNRIYSVLYRQRDIARRYTIQWGISPRSSYAKSIETNQRTSDTNDMVTSF